MADTISSDRRSKIMFNIKSGDNYGGWYIFTSLIEKQIDEYTER